MVQHYFFRHKDLGFTLVEVVVVFTFLTVMATIVFLTIDPGKYIAGSRNAQRMVDANSISGALNQYSVDHDGNYPVGIDTTLRMIGTSSSGCAVVCGPASGTTTPTLNQFLDINQDNFNAGIYANTVWNKAGWVELDSGGLKAGTGSYISSIKDAGAVTAWNTISWVPKAPYFKEIPDNNSIEEKYSSGNADMTGNVLLMHLNEKDGEIIDSSGNKNNGSSIALKYGAEGKFNTAIQFDGAKSSINIKNNATFNFTNELTMEAWVNPNASRTAKIIEKGDWDGFGIYQDVWKGWGASIVPQKGVGVSVQWDKGVPALNTWYYLAVTYDGKIVRFYVNGIEVTNAPLSGDFIQNGRIVSIGSDQGSQKFFSGSIDETAMYKRALKPEEILDHYNRGSLRLKFQVKSCGDETCVKDVFIGPDGTNSSYFSELNNTSGSLPSFNLTNISDNRYFQYKVLLENSSSSLTPKLSSVTTTNTTNGGGVIYPTTADACINLNNSLIPQYLAAVPYDPQQGSPLKSYYAVSLSGATAIIQSCNAELGYQIVSH